MHFHASVFSQHYSQYTFEFRTYGNNKIDIVYNQVEN